MPEVEDITDFIQHSFKEGPLTKLSLEEGDQFHTQWRDAENTKCVKATKCGNDVQITFKFEVTREYCNPAYQLHAAAQCLFYDNVMAYLILPLGKPGFWEMMGFTRNFAINLLRTAGMGEEVLLETKITHIGRNMCLLQGLMKRAKDGAVISTAEQNKFNSGAGNMMAKL